MTNTNISSPRSSLLSTVTLTSAAAGLAALVGCGSSQWPSSPTAVQEVARLDGSAGQLPEGLAVRGDTAYLNYVATSEVVAVDLKTGEVSPHGSLPKPAPNMGFVSGLALHGDDLFGALVSFAPAVQPGVYKVVPGGDAELYAKHPAMAFPNGLAFDDAGRMYITDSAAGAIFRVTADGKKVEKWLAHPYLAGAKDACGEGNGVGVPFDIGANGIAIDGDTIFVSNTDYGKIVRVDIQKDGAAGTPELFVEADCQLSGADGVTIAPDGDLIVAINHQHKLVRVTRDGDDAGRVTTLVSGDPLDFPASVTFEGSTLYISNFAFLDAKTPGLLRMR